MVEIIIASILNNAFVQHDCLEISSFTLNDLKVIDSSTIHSGKWEKYDVTEASTLWTHIACTKSGNCPGEGERRLKQR